jgi:phage I-like protein
MIRRMPHSLHPHISIAALSVDLTAGGNGAPTEFRLLPLGRFKSADGSGRPVGIPDGWLLSASAAKRVVALAAARSTRQVIDFEHQTLNAANNGKPAPAAGWIGRFEVRDDGLYAVDVEWTAQAAEMIAAKQYRYISPVFPFDPKTGEVRGIPYAALVNVPGLDGLTDLSAGAAALSALFMEDEPMKLLLAALGLAETASEAEALAALSALKSTHGAEVAALKADAGKAPDPAKYVAVAVLSGVQAELAESNAKLAALVAEKAQGEVDAVIAAALDAGKLTPATEPHARALAANGLAALKAFIDAAPVIAKPGDTQTGGKKPDGKSHQHTDSDVAVMKAMGLTPEQFASGKLQEA